MAQAGRSSNPDDGRVAEGVVATASSKTVVSVFVPVSIASGGERWTPSEATAATVAVE